MQTNTTALVIQQVPRQPQRQDATDDQLRDLQEVANWLGMYDAADVIRILLESKLTRTKVLRKESR